MVRSFSNEFAALMRRLERRPLTQSNKVNGTILTGKLFAPVFKPLIEKLNARFGTRLNVEGVANNYFGGDVSVAGLLTGGDFLQAKARIRGDFAIIPKTTLKSDEDIMLDGMNLEELTNKLGVPVHPLDLKSFSQFVLQKN